MIPTTITLNGRDQHLGSGTTVTMLVGLLGHDPARPGVAVAIDGDVVRRADWDSTVVDHGAAVEVVTAVQGGAR